MSKSVGIYIGTAEKIGNAYSKDIKNKISEKLDMLPEFYDIQKLRNSEDLFELKKVEYIFSTWGMAELSEEEIKNILPNLKAVFYAAGTVQYFARPYMNCGVKVFSAWGANAVPVAEVAAAEIILANKGFFQTVHNGSGAEWTEHDKGVPYCGNYDTNVGIIGAGMIGTLVIKKLKEYRLNTLVFDPFMTEERAAELGVEKVSGLPELFERCQVVSNHLANNPQTVNMIDKSCFNKMKPNGVFINTGRGQQVVEKDMIDTLKECPARCAVLDVTNPEPPVQGSELYTLPNIFLTPHMAGSIGNEIQRMGEYMYDEFCAFTENKPLKYLVTEKMLETMA